MEGCIGQRVGQRGRETIGGGWQLGVVGGGMDTCMGEPCTRHDTTLQSTTRDEHEATTKFESDKA